MKAFYDLLAHPTQFGIKYYRCSIVRRSWLRLQGGARVALEVQLSKYIYVTDHARKSML